MPPLLRRKLDETDVVQMAYLSAHANLASFEPRGDGSFRAWLDCIVENRFVDVVRQYVDVAKRGLDREETVRKVARWIDAAAERGAHLVAFGETLVPGYPHWLSYTGGAVFDSKVQKELHSHYLDQAVDLRSKELLGADLRLESRDPLSDEVLAAIQGLSALESTELTRLGSMALAERSGRSRRNTHRGRIFLF